LLSEGETTIQEGGKNPSLNSVRDQERRPVLPPILGIPAPKSKEEGKSQGPKKGGKRVWGFSTKGGGRAIREKRPITINGRITTRERTML